MPRWTDALPLPQNAFWIGFAKELPIVFVSSSLSARTHTYSPGVRVYPQTIQRRACSNPSINQVNWTGNSRSPHGTQTRITHMSEGRPSTYAAYVQIFRKKGYTATFLWVPLLYRGVRPRHWV